MVYRLISELYQSVVYVIYLHISLLIAHQGIFEIHATCIPTGHCSLFNNAQYLIRLKYIKCNDLENDETSKLWYVIQTKGWY